MKEYSMLKYINFLIFEFYINKVYVCFLLYVNNWSS